MNNTTEDIPNNVGAIPTIYSESALGIVRSFMTLISGVLVSKGLIAATASTEFIQLGIGTGMFLLTMAWSVYTKHKNKEVLLTALAEAELSEAQAKAKAAAGTAPSVLTAPSIVPVVKP